jgi:hypothetical protein
MEVADEFVTFIASLSHSTILRVRQSRRPDARSRSERRGGKNPSNDGIVDAGAVA